MKYENGCDCNAINNEKSNVAKNAIKDIDKLEKIVLFYKTFADVTRLKIICALDAVDSMCVCDIAEALNMNQSAVSHQLRVLKNAKLIKNRKEGKQVFYSLADDHVSTILAMGLEHIEEQ